MERERERQRERGVCVCMCGEEGRGVGDRQKVREKEYTKMWQPSKPRKTTSFPSKHPEFIFNDQIVSPLLHPAAWNLAISATE